MSNENGRKMSPTKRFYGDPEKFAGMTPEEVAGLLRCQPVTIKNAIKEAQGILGLSQGVVVVRVEDARERLGPTGFKTNIPKPTNSRTVHYQRSKGPDVIGNFPAAAKKVDDPKDPGRLREDQLTRTWWNRESLRQNRRVVDFLIRGGTLGGEKIA